MIDFSCRCYHKDRTPIVTDLYIQDYAEAVVRDYRPELLVTPGEVDAFHFLENYLGVTVKGKYPLPAPRSSMTSRSWFLTGLA